MHLTILQGAFLPVPPLLGGAVEKMWFRLGQEFAKRGHRVTHVSRQYPGLPDRDVINDVHHVRVPGYEQPASLVKLKFLDLLYSYRACRLVPLDSDIVVTNTFWSPILLARKLRGKIYADVARMPRGQCRLYTGAGRLRANSTPVAEAMRRELPISDQERIRIIPNPLPFDPPGVVDFSAKQKNILYSGRVHPEKGLDLLVKASSHLPPGWQVEIVGPWETAQGGGGRDYLVKLQSLANGLPVTFHGPEFAPDLLAEHYRRAAIFAYPSVAEKGETFGLSPLEAMAWGCVPVVSDLQCFKDFICHGVNGLVFQHRGKNAASNLQTSLESLMADPGLCERFSTQASGVGLTHSPSCVAEMFLEDFEQMRQGTTQAKPSMVGGLKTAGN